MRSNRLIIKLGKRSQRTGKSQINIAGSKSWRNRTFGIKSKQNDRVWFNSDLLRRSSTIFVRFSTLEFLLSLIVLNFIFIMENEF